MTDPMQDYVETLKARQRARDRLMHLAATIAAGAMPQQQGQLINPEEIADDAVAIAMEVIRKACKQYPASTYEEWSHENSAGNDPVRDDESGPDHRG